MFPVSFRPHTLKVVKRGSGSYDKNRNWVEGSETISGPIPCRYEPNGKANTITLLDGSVYRYSYTVYLSVNPSLDIKFGDFVELTSQDGVFIGRYEVKGFHRGQLDMKVWV